MNCFQPLGVTDVKPMHDALLANPEMWNTIKDRSIAGPHVDADDIWVRYNPYERLKANPHTFNDEHVPVWYPAHTVLAPVLMPIVNSLMTLVEGEMLGCVLITRVPAGKKVLPHKDCGWHVNYFDKFYVQLTGADGCEFGCEHEDGRIECYTPKAGDVYRFDNRKTHWVNNDSDTDRITLIVCIRTHKFERNYNV